MASAALLLAARSSSADVVTVSLVGTNDLHGHIETLPWLGGHLANLRRVRAADRGGVLLLDGGDLFQGTLESNMSEGAPVVRAYNALGYAAAAVGNHEFDFGPVGEAVEARAATDDARGALKARAREARFVFVSANLEDRATGKVVAWDNVRPSTVVEVAGVKVGIVGATTLDTPHSTLPANFAGLAVTPLVDAISREARQLRRSGVSVVVVAAHEGASCHEFGVPDDLGSCQGPGDIFLVARALPAGLVDAVIAGHTHDGVAHRVAGIPIVEAFSEGRGFGRIDLQIERPAGRVIAARIHPPRDLCAGPYPRTLRWPPDVADCRPAPYEGRPVAPDRGLVTLLAPDFERARVRREEPLGVTVTSPIRRARRTESALGNLFADLMHAARPAADAAITNGGGLRSDLPAGPLTYGRLFQAFPFDNGFATLRLPARDLAEVIARNLQRPGGILSISGVHATANCQPGDGRLRVELLRSTGARVRPDENLTIVTSDFLATGGDGLFAPHTGLPEGTGPIREALAAELRRRKGKLDGNDPVLMDATKPRLRYPGSRPIRCP